MQMMIFNGFLGQLALSLSQQLVIYTDTIVSQSLPMSVIDTFAHLQKFQIILDGFLVFLDIIIENSNRVVWSPLISNFSGPSAPKSQHFVVFQSSHGTDVDCVIDFFIERNVRHVLAVGFVQSCFLLQVTRWSIKK